MKGQPETILEQMLQHWVSEGEFYIGGFVLLKFIEPIIFACCMFYACIALKEIAHWVDIYSRYT